MRYPATVLCAAALLALPAAVAAGPAIDTHASYINVSARRAELASASPRVRQAVEHLNSCMALPAVRPPSGPMRIPMHYLHGNHGATNPAEREATQVYTSFEKRVTTGMNRFLATGSHAEAQCAQEQIDAWAQAGTLLDYDAVANAQSWYQTEWTLSAIATSESVLVNDRRLDPAETARDIAWMRKVAHHMIGFPAAATHHNNHHYWRGLAAIATGVVSGDASLFEFGVQAYKDAVNDIDARGSFPQEMARSERSLHYQSFALQPLVVIAEFAERQHVPLYSYKSPSGHTLAEAIDFLGRAVADPSILKAYTPDKQLIDADATDFFAAFEFYRHRFPNRGISPAIASGLAKSTYATRLGGSTTVLAGR